MCVFAIRTGIASKHHIIKAAYIHLHEYVEETIKMHKLELSERMSACEGAFSMANQFDTVAVRYKLNSVHFL